MKNQSQKIKAELVMTHSMHRQNCHACGGITERVHMVARVTTGPYEGFTICEGCLRSGDVPQRMLEAAKRLEAAAANLRRAAPHLETPTFAEWKAANDGAEEEMEKWYAEQEAEQKKGERLRANNPGQFDSRFPPF